MARRVIVQIYEVQRADEASALCELGVDHIGHVLLARDEWKNEHIKRAARAAQAGGAKSTLIPLFHDQETVFQALDYYQPDIVHFCESLIKESEDKLDELALLQRNIGERFPELKIMRSVPIAPHGRNAGVPTFEIARKFEGVSDFLLTDTIILENDKIIAGDQLDSTFFGITGKTCDWDVAAELVQKSSLPVILAGGIAPENVYEGIAKVRPYGIDSCTLTNVHDEQGKHVRFKKDLEKVKRLISEVRRAEKQ